MADTHPTPAAVRAAEVIANQIRMVNPDLDATGRAQLVDLLARIIDREHLNDSTGKWSRFLK